MLRTNASCPCVFWAVLLCLFASAGAQSSGRGAAGRVAPEYIVNPGGGGGGGEIEVPVGAPEGVKTLQMLRDQARSQRRRQLKLQQGDDDLELEVPVGATEVDLRLLDDGGGGGGDGVFFPPGPFVEQEEEEKGEGGEGAKTEVTQGRILHTRRNRPSSSSAAADPLSHPLRPLSPISPPTASSSEFVPVNSAAPARLELSPASKLHGAPGETVKVEFLLTNLGPRNYFTVLARESSSGFTRGGGDGGQYSKGGGGEEEDVVGGFGAGFAGGGGGVTRDFINFPSPSFLRGLSEVKPYLSKGETRSIALTIRVPLQEELGSRKVIFLEVQPFGNNAAGSSNSLSRRFYFAVEAEGYDRIDRQPPECRVLDSTYLSQCADFSSPGLCQQRRWTARFEIQDIGSGLRSVSVRPRVGFGDQHRFYSHDNFIAGGQTPIGLLYAGSCCSGRVDQEEDGNDKTFVIGGGSVAVQVTDVAGNQAACLAGDGRGIKKTDRYYEPDRSDGGGAYSDAKEEGGISTLTIAIAACAGVLLLVALAAIVAIIMVRKKRAAELAEMRETPQAR